MCSSDKIIITGFSKANYTNDYDKVTRECQHLLTEYGIMCDLTDIAPASVHVDGTKCDLIVNIREPQVFYFLGC